MYFPLTTVQQGWEPVQDVVGPVCMCVCVCVCVCLQAWARRGAADQCRVGSSGTPNVGESSASFFTSAGAPPLTCVGTIDLFYSEAAKNGYTYSNTPYTDNQNKVIGSFTQVRGSVCSLLRAHGVRVAPCMLRAHGDIFK